MDPFLVTRYDRNGASNYFGSFEAGLALVRSSLGLSYAFVLQHYLRSLLQNGSLVVLVTVEQSLERYQYALKKAGFNLQPFQQSGHLVVLEPPLAPLGEPVTSSQRAEFIAGDTTDSIGEAARRSGAGAGAGAGAASGSGRAAALSESDAVPAGDPTYSSSNRNSGRTTRAGAGCCSTLQQLYGAVCRAVEHPPPAATGVAVIFDSLTALASLREDGQDWTAFLHYCCSVAAAPSAQHGLQQQALYRVIVGVYDDVPDDGHWLASLEHRANVVISVENIPGRIADVDGMVTITQRFVANGADSSVKNRQGSWDAVSLAPWRKSLYFKASELAVKWMDCVTARELL